MSIKNKKMEQYPRLLWDVLLISAQTESILLLAHATGLLGFTKSHKTGNSLQYPESESPRNKNGFKTLSLVQTTNS